MKDSFVSEIRKYRMEHTKNFHSNIHEICKDLKQYQKKLQLEKKINGEKKFINESISK